MRSVWTMGAVGLALATGGAAAAQTPDDAAIRAVESAQEAAWNAHDARAYAALFTPDAELVNSLGGVSSGRDEVERRLGAGFATVFAASRMHVEAVASRPLGPDAAVGRVTWTISGARRRDGSAIEDRRIVQTQALSRVGGRWLIAALQDTAVLDQPPAASPASSGGAPASASSPAPAALAAPQRRCVLARANGECLIHGKAR